MKKKLPQLIFLFVYAVSFFVSFLFVFHAPVHAQQAGTPTPGTIEGRWVKDQEVTFVGKSASRSDGFLNWTLRNYDWIQVGQGQDNPLRQFFVLVRNTVYALIVLFVIASAFVIVVTRGQNLTVMRFIPRFILIIVLVTFAFSIVQIIYQVTDIIQGFLLKPGGTLISSKDLLYVGFNYEQFEGFRRVGPEFEESAFMTLLLTRLTAFTYYAMTALLLIRKIILWFFIIVSPVFPILLFYAPIRNTAKIWIGEFFRWVLYGPLFALFLHGLVVLWRSPAGIPLPFDFSQVGNAQKNIYPTAVNILLGGPGQTIGINNSVNLSDTFALYVVALLMLWVVTLLPFLLLNIFLDYLNSISLKDNVVIKNMYNRGLGLLGRGPVGPVPPTPPPPPGPQTTGLARALPFLNKSTGATIQTSDDHRISQTTIQNIHHSTDVLKLANLSIPKMRDIARYESTMLSRDTTRSQEVNRMHSTLEKIANPNTVASPIERAQFNTFREKLVQEKQKGDPLATSVLNASNMVVNQTSTTSSKTSVSSPVTNLSTQTSTTISGVQGEIKTSSIGAKAQEFAKSSTGKQAAGKAGITTLAAMNLPVVNRVQQVSLEDYEEVKKMWQENYQTLEPPKTMDGIEMDRKVWVKNDIEKINQAINLLSSIDPQRVNEGMEMVANVLPFLLIGGFSKTEVISYLKAKQEAGKQVLGDFDKKQEEEDTLLSRQARHTDKQASLSAEKELPQEKEKQPGEKVDVSTEKKELKSFEDSPIFNDEERENQIKK